MRKLDVGMSQLTFDAASVTSPSSQRSSSSIVQNQQPSMDKPFTTKKGLIVLGSSSYSKEELTVLKLTSVINQREYVPFLSVDLNERFAYPLPFTDRHGLLALSPKVSFRPNDSWHFSFPSLFLSLSFLLHSFTKRLSLFPSLSFFYNSHFTEHHNRRNDTHHSFVILFFFSRLLLLFSLFSFISTCQQKSRLKKWVRLDELHPNPKIFGHEIDCFSIKQTLVSDCSFMSSLMVSALYEKKFKKKLISNIIYPQNKAGDPVYNPCGKYMIKLHINGVRRKVCLLHFTSFLANVSLLTHPSLQVMSSLLRVILPNHQTIFNCLSAGDHWWLLPNWRSWIPSLFLFIQKWWILGIITGKIIHESYGWLWFSWIQFRML